MRADRYYPGFNGKLKWGAEDIASPYIPMDKGRIWYVDGDLSAGGAGGGWSDAFATVGAAITAASAFDTILVAPKEITDFTGDPASYEENLTIPAGKNHLSIVGVSRGRTQGGLPQFKDGATTTQHILRIRSNGCYIANLGFNGAGNTGGGILFDDDYSTKSAFGTTIENCHFKNCKGSTATNAATGGAVNWSSTGNSWQVSIVGNRFYKCVGDVVLPGTSNTVPQDVLIQGNIFSGPASATDCNLYLQGAGSGINGVTIDSNIFQQLPALGSATTARYIHATGCVGMLTRNYFGCVTDAAGTELTFKAAGTAAYIPTTMHAVGNYGQTVTDDITGEVNIS